MSTNRHHFIPRNDEAFDTFYRNLVDYVIDNAARWGHIKQADVNALELQLDDWTVVFDKTRVPHIPQLTAEKNRVRLACERALRHFINRFLRFEPVTDFDRDKMGIPNRDLVRTPHIDVTEVVEFELKLRNIREVLVNFWIKGQTHKAKPLGYDGAVIIWDVLDTPPASPADLTLHTMASKTPHALEFDETERGRTVYIAAAWQNERGLIGQWSEIQNAVIP
jgi:hypothetical protein